MPNNPLSEGQLVVVDVSRFISCQSRSKNAHKPTEFIKTALYVRKELLNGLPLIPIEHYSILCGRSASMKDELSFRGVAGDP